MQKPKNLWYTWGWWIAAAMAVLTTVALLWQPWTLWRQNSVAQPPVAEGEVPDEQAAQSLSQGGFVSAATLLDQTLHYLPCGHSVQRRVPPENAWIGMDRAAIEKALPDYRVTAFGSKEIVMQRDMGIFCPKHWVLKPDDQGELTIWQNELGEAMVRVRGLGIGAEDVPESERESVRSGKPFDTLETLEGWLESADS